MGWEGMEWINLAQDDVQVVGYCECHNEPLGCRKCEFFE
jgi:hypothetical protein